VWVFVYGSLMWEGWEKALGGNLVGKATIRGFHRAFNKKSTRNWGSRDAPAPTLGLEPDRVAACTGLLFRFPDTSRTQVLEYFAEREGPGFALEGLEARLEDGPPVIALTPVNDPRHHTYLGRVGLADRARMASVAVGKRGTGTSYVENVRARLRELGIADEHVEEFCQAMADL
jgi:cation transport protein ChaC